MRRTVKTLDVPLKRGAGWKVSRSETFQGTNVSMLSRTSVVWGCEESLRHSDRPLVVGLSGGVFLVGRNKQTKHEEMLFLLYGYHHAGAT